MCSIQAGGSISRIDIQMTAMNDHDWHLTMHVYAVLSPPPPALLSIWVVARLPRPKISMLSFWISSCAQNSPESLTTCSGFKADKTQSLRAKLLVNCRDGAKCLQDLFTAEQLNVTSVLGQVWIHSPLPVFLHELCISMRRSILSARTPGYLLVSIFILA